MLGSSPLLSGRSCFLYCLPLCVFQKKEKYRKCRVGLSGSGHRSGEAEAKSAQLPKSAARVSRTLFLSAQAQAELGGRGGRGGIARQGAGG